VPLIACHDEIVVECDTGQAGGRGLAATGDVGGDGTADRAPYRWSLR
jgi:hypothetical protein